MSPFEKKAVVMETYSFINFYSNELTWSIFAELINVRKIIFGQKKRFSAL